MADESSPKAPRRLVLLREGDHSEVDRVLADMPGNTAGSKLHAELLRLAGENVGRTVAAEWEGPLGWTRFLWCRR